MVTNVKGINSSAADILDIQSVLKPKIRQTFLELSTTFQGCGPCERQAGVKGDKIVNDIFGL